LQAVLGLIREEVVALSSAAEQAPYMVRMLGRLGCAFILARRTPPVSCQQEWDKSGLRVKTHFLGLGGQAAARSVCVCC
jgi:hypothetical protein